METGVFNLFLSYTISLVLSFLLYFPFRWLADRIGFYAVPNARSSHRDHIPNIGGLLFYLSPVLALAISRTRFIPGHFALFTLLSVLSFMVIGLVDDKGSKSAWQKLLFQSTGTVLFLAGDQEIFRDLFGIMKLHFPFDLMITFIFILTIINAMNLIDGIDGLAGMLGLTIFLVLGIFFYLQDSNLISVFCFSMSGILSAFIYFNFSKKYKMIMGDTGSLWIGFSLSILMMKAYHILAISIPAEKILVLNRLAVFGLVIVPVFDLMRVFLLRIMKGNSPFRGDRKHIHHILLDKLNMTHTQATLAIVSSNLFFFLILVVTGMFFKGPGIIIVFMILFLLYNAVLHSIVTDKPLIYRYFKLNSVTSRKAEN